MILLAGGLVAAGFAGISHGIALLTRQEATMIAVANFIGLPLLFLSSSPDRRELMPGLDAVGGALQPRRLGRDRARASRCCRDTDWGRGRCTLGGLVAFAVATGAFATWAFGAYQR